MTPSITSVAPRLPRWLPSIARRGLMNVTRALLVSVFLVNSAWAATYYIDFASGNDGNSGLSTSAPWKVHPYMRSWTGGNKYTHVAGDSFIFKGGVVWNASALPLTIAASGSSSAADYYGVDTTWFAGSSFTRPIFDAQGTSTTIVQITTASNISIDSLELRDVVFSSNQGSGLITIDNTPKNILIKNSFLHKWTLAAGISTDDAHGGVIVNTANVPPVGIIVDSSIISNTEYSSTRNNGVAIRNVQTVRFSTIHDVPTAVLFAGDVNNNHIFNINYPNPDFDRAYHTNLVYMAAQSFNPPVNRIYNNRIHDVGTGAGIYAEPCFYSTFGSASIHIYNNVVYNARMYGGGIILVDPEGGSGSCGSVAIYNNTLQQPEGSQIGMIRTIRDHVGTNRIGNLVIANNLYIGPNGEWDTNFAATWSSTNNLQLSNAAATSAGYALGNLFKPTTGTSPTVGKARTLSCGSCPGIDKDVVGILRGQGGTWDIGAYEFYSGLGAPVPAPMNLQVK